LINLPPRSHIDTVSESNASWPVTGRTGVAEATSVGELVGDAETVGGTVKVGSGVMLQNRRSRSPFVAEREGSFSKIRGPTVPSGQA